jgi:hypothetical protein
MANNRKRSFLSLLFGKRKQDEHEEPADMGSKQRLEERIQQIFAEMAAAPEPPKLELLVIEKKHAVRMPQEEAEPEVELLPISASVIGIRKAPVPSSFLPLSFEVPRSYAANER